MTHREVHLMEIWHTLRKRRWIVVTSVAVLFTTVTLGTFLIRPTYKATAVIQIERENPKIVNFSDVVSPDDSYLAYSDFYRTQHHLIRSREVLRRVSERLDLAHHPVLAATSGPGPVESLTGWMRSLLPQQPAEPEGPLPDPGIDLAAAGLEVDPVKNTHLVEISFLSPDPKLCAQVADAVAEEYILFNADVKTRTTGIAGEKLETEVRKLSEEIEQLERGMHAFGERGALGDLGNRKTLALTTLEEITHSLTQASIQRARKEALYEALRSADPESLEAVRSSPTIQALKNRLSELERAHVEKQALFKPDYPEMISLRSQIIVVREQLEAEVRQIRNQVVQGAETEFRTADGEERRLDALAQAQRDRVHTLERSLAEYETLQSALLAKKETRTSVIRRRDETGVLNRMDDTLAGNVWLVEAAQAPKQPFRPNRRLNMLVSLVLGAGLGIGLAFFFEYVDNSVKSTEDLEKIGGIATLGLIPGLKRRGSSKVIALDAAGRAVEVECITHDAPKSNVAEAYRDLRTTLLLSSPDQPPRILMVTSSQPREGKTVTALNVAISLTQVGRKVLLLDADLRKPRLHKPLGLERTTGLTNGLTGNARWEDLIQTTRIPGLWLLAAGPIPPNPAELLASRSFEHLMSALRQEQRFDHVVVDTPPILAVADPVIVSEHADGVLMVVHAGQTPAPSVAAGLEKLKAAKARVLGAILNALDFAEQDYYSYRYGYRYGYYSQGDAEPEHATTGAADGSHPARSKDAAGETPGGAARSGSART